MTVGSPLAAYARWQARDSLPRALMPLGLALFVGGLPLWGMVRAAGSLALFHDPGDYQTNALILYRQTAQLAMTLGAIAFMSGVPSLDRERQFVRFLFAKPVVPWLYYLQRFVIALALFVFGYALIPLAFGAVVTPVPVLAAMRSAALYASLYGSLALLCGALANRDGLWFILFVLAGNVFQQLARAGAAPRWLELSAQVLPPFLKADAVRTAWLNERAAQAGDLWHVLAYTAGMLIAALWLIRTRPLAR